MKDLDIRGAGNLLGGEQSGFITDIGYNTYQKILEEAVQELKETEFKEVFKEDLEKERSYVTDVTIETDVEMLIPDNYVKNIQERLALYTELDGLQSEDDIKAFAERLQDRFGKLPRQITELFEGLRLRWVCKSLGFERVILKGKKLRCYFVTNPQSPFYETAIFNNLVQYVSSKGERKGLSFKQSTRHFIMVKDHVKNLQQANEVLQALNDVVERVSEKVE